LQLRSGDRLIPNLLLVGRDAARLKALATANHDLRWTTSLDEALSIRCDIHGLCSYWRSTGTCA
jgi:hypothetical protein